MNFAGELSIPVFLNIGCTFSIMPKSYYNRHAIFHKCQKMQITNYIVIHTDNGDIKVCFWITLQLNIQQVVTQLQLLVGNAKARTGILFGIDAFDQLGS